jgi:hypothetical protein
MKSNLLIRETKIDDELINLYIELKREENVTIILFKPDRSN